MLPIILDNVALGSTEWTDEHKSYSKLSSLGYDHDTVCYNREFVSSDTGVNTQAIESFNNEVDLEIKQRNGINTDNRQAFLNEFV